MTHTPVVMESSQQSDFIKYWLMVRRRWLPASLTFLVVLVISLFRVYQEEPKYIASGQLKFEEGQRSSELIGWIRLSMKTTWPIFHAVATFLGYRSVVDVFP